MTFGTIIADPPWAYEKLTKSRKEAGRSRSVRESDGSTKTYYLSGYSSHDEYKPLKTADLCELPVRDLARDDSVLLLWTTMPMINEAMKVIEAWGFTYVTGMPWVKIDGIIPPKPVYGVGYWFRGATELILVGKRKKSYRTNYIGFMSESFEHSRKPDDLHGLAEACFPGPYLELFGRRSRSGWTVLGDESPECKGEDIAVSLKKMQEKSPSSGNIDWNLTVNPHEAPGRSLAPEGEK